MKSSLKKLRGFALHKHDSKAITDLHYSAQLDELAQASQEMEDMRNCYDSLLSAAAATTNSAYEFSESLREMGACLLERTALNDDEDGGRILLMLGKVQFELQKLVDSYRSHIVQTITTPSESLLNELRTVEEMKHQCDEKRRVYEDMMAALRDKGRTRNSKGHISSQQLQAAHEDYDEEATLFVFRLKSLKQGQSRSLLTQAARHYAAQLSFFKKGHKSLEAIEPQVKVVTEQQHIDYQFSGLEDDDLEEGDDDDSSDTNDGGELSFDYGKNEQGQEVSTARNSMELDQVDLVPVLTTEGGKEYLNKNPGDLPVFGRGPVVGSQSAPLFYDKKFDQVEKIRNVEPSPTRKFHTYVLPTPMDCNNSTQVGGSNIRYPGVRQTRAGGNPQNISHSSPLEPRKLTKYPRDLLEKPDSVLTESDINNPSRKIPPPLTEGHLLPHSDPFTPSDHKKIKRYAFSGPLTGKAWSSKPILSSSGPIHSVEHPQLVAAKLQRVPLPQPSASPKISPSSSPPMMQAPKISELHELPRPPISSGRLTRPSSLIGHSAPLVPRSQEVSTTNNVSLTTSSAAPLPVPPGSVPRSFSIPSRGPRAKALNMANLLDPTQNSDATEVASPPLTPMSLTTAQLTSAAAEAITRSRKSADL